MRFKLISTKFLIKLNFIIYFNSMAEVNLWEPNDGHIGHCSLTLDDGSYVSFRPCGE
jgi:hypothetical protein